MEIIEELAPKIKANPQIHAMWIEGSYATGEHNAQSDIDVWLDVDDGSFDSCLADFRLKLQTLAEIKKEIARGVYSDSPKLMKQTFILKGFPKGQHIELDLQEHSRRFKFSRKEHAIKILFDKERTIQWGD